MAARIASIVILGASAAFASPLAPRRDATVTVTASSPAATPWDAGAVHDYPIHASCNATQHAYIKQGLDEAITICSQARDHILRWGNSSEIYQKYFGNSSTGEPLGWFTKIVDGDKSDVLFRCDNIDGNCNQDGWAGHWRGKNASSETVICDLSYEVRKPLNGMCMFGYDVANGATNTYWASDLLHRLLHVPKVGEGIVEHYSSAPKYPGVLELAESNPAWAVRNSDTLQYFALEVYAHDIALPGVGCAGHYTAVPSSADSHAAPTSSAAASSVSASVTITVTATATDAASEPASASSTATQAAQACTPHDDHWHCPPGVPEPANPPA